MRLLAVVLLIIGWTPAAWGQAIAALAWLEDPEGTLSWEQAQGADQWTDYAGLLSLGYGRSVIWVRVTIDAGAPARSREGETRILRIQPTYLDSVAIFDPAAASQPAALIGDRHHPSGDAIRGPSFYYLLPEAAPTRDLYLRLHSTSTRQLLLDLHDPRSLAVTETRQRTLSAGYLGVVCVLIVWAGIHWLLTWDRLSGFFALSQAFALLYALAAFGYLRTLWPDLWPAWLLDDYLSITAMLAVAASVIFHLRFLLEFDPPRWAKALMVMVLAWQGVKPLIFLAGAPMVALALNMLDIFWLPVLFFVLALLGRRWRLAPIGRGPVLPRWLVIAFYLLTILILGLASMPGLGVLAGPEVALSVVQFHGLLTGLVMLAMLQYRANELRLREQRLQNELANARVLAHQERRVRNEQETLLAMLAHELRNPLATMQMRLRDDSPEAPALRRAIVDMSGVIDRCMQLGRVGSGLTPRIKAVDLPTLIRSAAETTGVLDRLDLDSGPEAEVTVRTDPQLLFVILSNLLDNAGRYSLAASPIEVVVQVDPANEGRCRVLIGNAVEPAVIPDSTQVFEKYYRGPHARKQSGAGLGLYLVRSLAGVLGGGIEFQCAGGRATLTLTLP